MRSGTTWAIVPVKTLADAKQRLAGVLPLEARRRLMLLMLEDVLATLRQVDALDRILVVTPDADVSDIAQCHGAHVLRETHASGHSAAAIAGFAQAHANGASHALTLPADAPFVTNYELRRLLQPVAGCAPSPRLSAGVRPLAPDAREYRNRGGEGSDPCSLTLVPSRDGDGTNAILVSPPDAFTPRFGPGSFARHLAQAATSGIACRTLELPGVGLDIDEPHDLRELMQRTRGNPRYAFLARYILALAQAGEP